MLHPDTLQFFEDLAVNNNREWFAANKKRWDDIKAAFEEFTSQLIQRIVPLDPSLGDLKAKQCIYRIYRDVRFSTDKSPYKTHIACFLPTGGNRRSAVPGYYIQIGQEDYGLHGCCALGGGIFCPTPEALAAIRQEIFYNIEEFKAIINHPNHQRYFGSQFYSANKLSRVPKGYPSDWPDADLLKYKDYTTMYAMPEKYVLSDQLLDRTVEVFAASVPLNKFIQKAMYELL
ncbi:MAG: DUF2461 domain-containing protein [Bacteroidales bacterium]|nr:DUF2461 domain-containing protein [Candidatus Colimorpha onthohippi]